MEVGGGLTGGGVEDGIEGQEGEENRKIRHGIEDMSGIDGMIMVRLGHEGNMRGFSEGRGQVTEDGGRNCGHTRPRRRLKKKNDGGIGGLTFRGNVTRWMGLAGNRGIWAEMAMGIGQGIIKKKISLPFLQFIIVNFLYISCSLFVWPFIFKMSALLDWKQDICVIY